MYLYACRTFIPEKRRKEESVFTYGSSFGDFLINEKFKTEEPALLKCLNGAFISSYTRIPSSHVFVMFRLFSMCFLKGSSISPTLLACSLQSETKDKETHCKSTWHQAGATHAIGLIPS